ncbi:hypothetical protein MNB_SM-4-887 [hydrothermal vent metagenome]|uniref:Uncharacterized protein n=1 Tax=hydrothermal vent metagenome TaxID=652676 RepID=A0A1W1BSH8_9ZZZZ
MTPRLNIIVTLLFAITFFGCGGESDDTTTNNTQTSTIQKLTVPNVNILPIGETRTIQVSSALDNPTFSLENAPSWISINSTSGLIQFNTPQTLNQSYSFKVLASNSKETLTSRTIYGTIKEINQDLYVKYTEPTLKIIEETPASINTVRYGSTLYVPNKLKPQSDAENTWDVINIYYENYGGNIELVIVDGDTKEIKHEYVAKGAWNGMTNLTSKEGNLYMISAYKGKVLVNVYNPKTNITTYDVVKFPDDFKYTPWLRTRIGTDGTLFIKGGYNNPSSEFNDSPRYIEIDTATNTIVSDNGRGEHIGMPSYALNFGADDEYLYFVIGVEGARHKAYSYKRESPHNITLLADGADYTVNISQTAHGVVLGHDGIHEFLYQGTIHAPDGESWRWTTPPWPFPEGTTEDKIHDSLRIRHNVVDEYLPKEPLIIKQNSNPNDSKAELWIQQPNEGTYQQFRFSVKSYKAYLNEILKLPNGKFLISSNAYGPYILYNPTTKKYNEIGSIGLSDYSLLNYTKDDGTKVVYMSGYPRGVLYEYDYNKPWTQQKHTWKPGDPEIDHKEQSLNPRWCGAFGFTGSEVHKVFSSTIGADGYVYFGGQNIRSDNSGGLGWYNPNGNSQNTKDDMGGTWEDFSNYAISDIKAIMGGKYLAISTIPVTDRRLNKPQADNGRLFLFDVFTKKVVKYWDPVADIKRSSGDIVASDGPYARSCKERIYLPNKHVKWCNRL